MPAAPRPRGRYIAIAGPIGVGKSSLAEIVAEELDATYVKEVFAANPFLERFYEPDGIARWGLACEMSFLPPRFDQGQHIRQLLEAGHDVVTDFVLQQNLVYSRITLSDEEFAVYEGVFHRLMATAPLPDCLVMLDAPVEHLLERIRGRGRSMEANIDPGYVAQLRSGYLAWKDAAPVANTVWLNTVGLPIPTCDLARATALQAVFDAAEVQPAARATAPVRLDTARRVAARR